MLFVGLVFTVRTARAEFPSYETTISEDHPMLSAASEAEDTRPASDPVTQMLDRWATASSEASAVSSSEAAVPLTDAVASSVSSSAEMAPVVQEAVSSVSSEPSAAVVETPPAPPVEVAQPAPESERPASTVSFPKNYKVWIYQENGDCLWRIAQKVYGDKEKWRIIYLANRDVIRDPNKIYPKQRLRIPPADWQP